MTEKSFPERLYEAGFTDLVSVIPPGAKLVPSSTISQASVGKVPGSRRANGLWGGYDWRRHEPAIDDVRQWVFDGANVGLRATNFPAVDIDTTDPQLAQMVEDAALAKLGIAPIRVGRAPKRLLMYRTAEPFTRMRLVITALDGAKHLVEILGEGQQYLVHGMHPSGKPYTWNTDPSAVPASMLTTITREQASDLLDHVAALIDLAGLGTTNREGTGKRASREPAGDQQALLAPSIEKLTEVVELIPNDDEIFPDREDYVKIGYAIRAAAGEHEEEGFAIFAAWADKHTGKGGRVAGNPETWRSDWRRFNPPFSIGWSFLAQLARPYGYNDVGDIFEATGEAPDLPLPGEEPAPVYSDLWLAEQIINKHRGVLRFVPQRNEWLVWDGSRWKPDAVLMAQNIIQRALKVIALPLTRVSGSAKEMKEAEGLAKSLTSAKRVADVMRTVRADEAMALPVDALDHDLWSLNTPGGVVDLRSGLALPPDPDALMTKTTRVAPDFGGAAPLWKRFLAEATGGNVELEAYLQRLAGYCLTGSTREEQLTVVFGPGGRGKGTFVNTIAAVMGDYAKNVPFKTFTVERSDSHPTDLAGMMGARLVTAGETTAGRRWDDAKVKMLTGGDPVSARFMREDFFTYKPTFKLIFSVNAQPELRDVDDGMKRRIQMVPFQQKPARVDMELKNKLEEEYPAILAWMIEGCLAWQEKSLTPPRNVQIATAEYFEMEDSYGQWLEEATEEADGGITSQRLFESWQEWANPRGIYAGTMKRMVNALKSRGLTSWREPETRHRGFAGLQLKERSETRLFV